MILLKVESEGNMLRAELPSDEIVDHLGSIGVGADIKVSGTDTVKVELFAEENNLIAAACFSGCGYFHKRRCSSGVYESNYYIRRTFKMDKKDITIYKYGFCKGFLDKLYKNGKITEKQLKKIDKAVQKRLVGSI